MKLAVKTAVRRVEDARELVLGFTYLPYAQSGSLPSRKVWNLIESCFTTRKKMDILFGCDPNSHRSVWGSSDINR